MGKPCLVCQPLPRESPGAASPGSCAPSLRSTLVRQPGAGHRGAAATGRECPRGNARPASWDVGGSRICTRALEPSAPSPGPPARSRSRLGWLVLCQQTSRLRPVGPLLKAVACCCSQVCTPGLPSPQHARAACREQGAALVGLLAASLGRRGVQRRSWAQDRQCWGLKGSGPGIRYCIGPGRGCNGSQRRV